MNFDAKSFWPLHKAILKFVPKTLDLLTKSFTYFLRETLNFQLDIILARRCYRTRALFKLLLE